MKSKAVQVIRREYLANVRKRSFLVGTIVVPLFMLVVFALPIIFAIAVPDRQYRLLVVDQTSNVGKDFAALLGDTLDDGRAKYIANVITAPAAEFARRKGSAVARLSTHEADIIIAIPETVYDDGKVDYVSGGMQNINMIDEFQDALSEVVLKNRLAREGIDYTRVKSLTTRVDLQVSQVTGEGDVREKNFLSEYGIVVGFVMLLYMALFTWGVTVSRSIIEEKGSRVIEVLLSSIAPRDLVLGKVIGVGLAGLTQLAIWALVAGLFTFSSGPMALSVMANVDISPSAFLYLFVFFVLGFLFYSAVFMVVGAVCSNDQDAQQLQGLVTMPMILPIVTLMSIIQNPGGTLAVAMSLFPPFTPMIMLARVILYPPPTWQIVLSVVLLIVATYGAINFASRVFRVGILMYGKRPSLREIFRWYKVAR